MVSRMDGCPLLLQQTLFEQRQMNLSERMPDCTGERGVKGLGYLENQQLFFSRHRTVKPLANSSIQGLIQQKMANNFIKCIFQGEKNRRKMTNSNFYLCTQRQSHLTMSILICVTLYVYICVPGYTSIFLKQKIGPYYIFCIFICLFFYLKIHHGHLWKKTNSLLHSIP